MAMSEVESTSGSSEDFKFVSALSRRTDPKAVADEIMSQVVDEMGNRTIDMAIAFMTPEYTDSLSTIMQRIHDSIWPRITLGVSAQGVIGQGHEVEESNGFSFLAASMPGSCFHPFSYADLDWPNAKDDPELLAANLLGPDLRSETCSGLILFVDPFSVPMIELLPAINRALPGIPVVGGVASAAQAPGDNRLILDGRISESGLVGVAIGGSVNLECVVSQGCRPVGRTWIVTKSHRNLIYEVGQRPVLDVVHETIESLDDDESELVKQGLFIGRVTSEYKDRFGRGDFLIRNVIGADPVNGFLVVNDLVRVGQTIQFHIRDARTAEEDLELLLDCQQLTEKPDGVLLTTCNGRGVRMFGEHNKETAIIRHSLGDVPTGGFFAAGEFGPIGGENFVHGFTASLAVFRKKRVIGG